MTAPRGRRLLIPILMAAALVSPALGSALGPAPAAAKEQAGAKLDSTLGSYLAGRFAQLHGNAAPAIDFYRAVLEEEPGNTDVARRLLAMLISEGRMDEALKIARTVTDGAADENEEGRLAPLALAIADIKAGKFAEAEAKLDALPETGLNTIAVPMLSAWTLAAQKRFDAALEELSIKDENQGFAVLYGAHAAAINEFAGRTEAAEKGYLQSAEGRQRANLRLTQLLGNFYERTGRQEEARKLYDAYMDEHPSSTMLSAAYKRLDSGAAPEPEIATPADGAAEAMFSIAGSVQQQSTTQAIVFGRLAVYLNPDLAIAKLLIAETLEAERRYEDAIKVYRDVSSDSNYSWAARLRIADAHDALEQVDQAIAELRAMAREAPERADALIRLGDILRRHKRYEEAAEAYEEAKTRIPKLEREHWTLLYANGIVHERIKKWDKAEAEFLKALEFEPEQPYVLNYLGYSWVDMGKNLDRALDMIKLAVEKRPRDGYIIDSLGWVHYRLGNMEEAVKQLERAVSIQPEDPTINDHLGDVYWHVGRRDEARFQWQRALSLEPEEDMVPKIKKKLKDGLPAT